MKIYLYHKVDRGYYESARVAWKAQGGRFADHLLRSQTTFYSWKQAFEQLGHTFVADMRSSFLLPQTLRCYLPNPLSSLLRGGLWVTKVDPYLLQQDIVRRIEKEKPDVVFIPLGSAIWESTLRTLKQRGHKLVQWCGLPAATMLARDRRNLPYFDLIFTPANLEHGLRAAGAVGRIEYMPIGINPEIQKLVTLTQTERAAYGSDVCFIGGLGSRFHSTRRQMVEYAIENGVSMKIWGGTREQFTGSPILKCWQGQIWGAEVPKALCASKIGLNFHVDHQPGELDRGLNVRAFELAACGVFQLLQRVPSVGEFFEEGKEIICFDTKEEMLEKIRYYLHNEQQRVTIATQSTQRMLQNHTWLQRVACMQAPLESLVHA